MTLPKLSVQKIAAIIIGVLAVSAGVFFGFRALSSRASNNEPQNVSITDINENSATVKWASTIESQCTLEYGTSPTSLNFFGPETVATTNHSIKLSLLSPKTTYYFQIKCGENTFTNAGVPWSFSTRDSGVPIASPSASLEPTTLVSTPTSAPVIAPTTTVQDPATRPSPIQTIKAPSSATCTETTCSAIKAKLGQGCTTQDYFQCIYKLTPTPGR